jgi:acyl-CoA synthetase (AMP-forming)/AMP-acid ligase II
VQLANEPHIDNDDRSSIEIMVTGGATCTPAMQEAIKDRLPNVKYISTVHAITILEAISYVTCTLCKFQYSLNRFGG